MTNTQNKTATELIQEVIARLKTEPGSNMKFVHARELKQLLELSVKQIEVELEVQYDRGFDAGSFRWTE